jgi:TonB-linked SusC/RagA family outer membrane protein
MNVDGNISDKFSIGTSINLGYTSTRNNTVSLAGLPGSALSTPPVIPVYNPDGSYAARNPDPNAVADFNNPVAMAKMPVNNTKNSQVLANFFGEYKLLPNLSLKTSFGVDASGNKNGAYTPGALPGQKWLKAGGEASISQTQSLNWQNENTINFSTKVNGNDWLEAVAGFTYQAGTTELMSESAKKFATDATTYNNMSLGDPLTQVTTSDYSAWNIISFLGRANYRLKNRYLFSVAGRYDGSSRLGRNNKYAFFPSGAFAWILSDEPFIKDLGLFSFLKFRTSYGVSGNQAVGIYQTLSTLATTPFISGDNSTVALVPSRIENPDLKWETLHQFDLGLESGFFNNTLRVEVDYYNTRTKDLLLDVEIPYQTGYGTMLRNVGEVSNQGVELTINTVNINTKDFHWETSFNIAANRNKVVSLGGKNDIITHTYNYGLQPAGILRVGQPIGSFFGAITEGLWQSADEIARVGTMPTNQPGTRRYKDLSGDGKFTNVTDYTILGNGNPKFFGGIQNSLRYKNFGLSFFFEGTYGNKIFNGWTAFNGSSDPTTNQFADAVNRWTETNRNTDIPRAGGDRLGEERTPSDKWIFNGSHLRLKTLSFVYTLPSNIDKRSILKGMTVTLTAVNLWLLTDYKKGYDPEVNTFGASSILRGYDYGAYPNNRSLTLGVNLNF